MGEDQRFDFKSGAALRRGKDSRLSQSISAFANTRGGFLVYGVDQNSNGRGWMCKPCPLSTEVSKWLNEKIRVDPMPEIPAAKVVTAGIDTAYYVLHVPASRFHVHSAEGVYYHRTLSGNLPMPPEMLRERFLGLAERQARVKVLIQEMDELYIEAGLYNGVDPEGKGPTDLAPLDASTLLRMRSELILPLSSDADAVESLRLAASAIRRFNGQVAVAMMQMADPNLRPRHKQQWSLTMHAEGKNVKAALNRARQGVGRVFSVQVPNWTN